jgi:hypothetical protein
MPTYREPYQRGAAIEALAGFQFFKGSEDDDARETV